MIPEALHGTSFNLTIKDTVKQFISGNLTVTGAINNHNFWGPTIFVRKGDEIQMNVTNNLNEETTLHWHGMHLPAVMDGGPHQIIPPGTLWQPYWKVDNNAATYWYHPHLHEMTTAHIAKGIGGFLIVQDDEEAALPLPRTYGTDDFVMALSSRRFTSANQIDYTTGPYGDYAMVNGTLNPQLSLPKQVVRLRILNAEIERGYNLGFSDNRTFYIIANDGGLLNTPIAATRVKLMVGERVEILVDLSNDAAGSTLDLKAYNSGQTNSFPGGEPQTTGQFGSLLNNTTFNVLHILVANTTAGAITSVPTALVNNTYLTAADATVNRTLTVTGGQNASAFSFDNTLFNIDNINKTVNLNTTEKWAVTNNNVFGHAFHIHDVQFKIISRSTGSVGTYESGWKDTFFISRNETVTFVARFNDYADAEHPFMYHCHFGQHEDGGMMGQFVVVDTAGLPQQKNTSGFTPYPNPVADRLYLKFDDDATEVYYITVTDINGRVALMLPQPKWQNGIDTSTLQAGVYLLKLTDRATKTVSVKKFIKS